MFFWMEDNGMKPIILIDPDGTFKRMKISVVEQNHEVIHLLRNVIHTEPNSILGIRFNHNVVNNVFIEDAYIYRMS